MARLIALLRGINVGGNKKVPMEKLRNMLEEIGFKNVKTLLNSGNVAFDSEKTDEKNVAQIIEEQFVKTFGFTSKIMIRSRSEIDSLIKLDPFKAIKEQEKPMLYVSFLDEKSHSSLSLPYVSTKKDFHIVQKTDREVFWFIIVSPTTRTTDAMAYIEKEFGKGLTTRNWNTVLKLINL